MTSATDSQVDLFPPDDDERIGVPWVGIALDHRRLFDALQDGWLRPLPDRSGVLIGVGAYAAEHCRASSGHPILVRIKLELMKLPILDVEIRRQERWESSPLAQLAPSDEKFYWEGAVPTFAFSEYLVANEEERIRLTGLARQIANVDLPEASIRVGSVSDEDIESDTSLPSVASRLVVPSAEDAIRGAMTMAIWAVPRIEPWLDILTASLSHDRGRLPELTDEVDARWWRFPPWVPSHDARPCRPQESLWLAAIDVFRATPTEVRAGSRELAERIADAMPRFECHEDAPQMASWLDSTLNILRASSTVRFDDWHARPVEIALQLVLARPEPANFRTWFRTSQTWHRRSDGRRQRSAASCTATRGLIPSSVAMRFNRRYSRFMHCTFAPTTAAGLRGHARPLPRSRAGEEPSAMSCCHGGTGILPGSRKEFGEDGMRQTSRTQTWYVRQRIWQRRWIGNACSEKCAARTFNFHSPDPVRWMCMLRRSHRFTSKETCGYGCRPVSSSAKCWMSSHFDAWLQSKLCTCRNRRIRKQGLTHFESNSWTYRA